MAEGDLDAADPLDPNEAGLEDKLKQQHVVDLETEARALLGRRKEAYSRLFAGNPMPGDAELVLADLRNFTKFDRVPWDSDPRVHAVLTGRYEVFKRIDDHILRSLDALTELYS